MKCLWASQQANLRIAQSYKSREVLFKGNNAHSMATPAQLESIKKALSFDRPPLCSGAISPPPEGLYLYYGKKNAKYVQFSFRYDPPFLTSFS